MALLAGYAFTNKTGLTQTVASPNSDKYQSVVLNTHDYIGEQQERLDFPKDWQVDVMRLAGEGRPTLSPEQIIQKLRSPIGTKQLRDIAAGKKSAVVTFDDLSRPTPVHLIAEHVANELNAAGIDDDHILFICAIGSHQSMTHMEAMWKLGPVFTRCPWMSHNVHMNNIEVGRTSWNNMIQANGYLVKADVKVTIGAIRDHIGFGYSGGAKSIVPGTVSLKTIFYNFSINVVQTGKRQVMDLYCGDIFDAHIEACRFAVKNICWDREVKDGDYDIVVSNSYPASRYSPIQFGRPRNGGTSISVSQAPHGRHMHYLHDSGTWNMEPWWIGNYNPRTAPYDRIILSQYMSKALTINYKDVIIHPTWDKILPILEKKYSSGAKVLVYPYGSIAHAPKKKTLYPEDVKKG
jgi:hypothetical protein